MATCALGAIAVASPLGPACSTNPVLFGSFTNCETDGFYVSNFQITSGATPSDASLQIGQLGLGEMTVNLESNNLNSSFTMTYSVALDPGVWGPPAVISTANVGLQANGSSNALLVKTIGAQSDNFSQVGNVGTDSGPITGINATSINVQDVYTYTSGGILNASNSFNEATPATTPEPSTMLLMGGALLGLGAIARRRKKSVA